MPQYVDEEMDDEDGCVCMCGKDMVLGDPYEDIPFGVLEDGTPTYVAVCIDCYNESKDVSKWQS